MSAGRRRPPRTPPSAAPRMLRDLVTDRLAMMTTAAERHGDAVRMVAGPKTLYFFNHPDHAKHVLAENSSNYHKGIGQAHARRALGDGLLTSEGEIWRAQRQTMRPVFRHQRIAAQADAVAKEATALVDRLRSHVGGGPVDVSAEATGLTLGVLGRTLLDTDLHAFDTIGTAFEAVQDQAMLDMVTMNGLPVWLPFRTQTRFRRARGELQRIVDRLVRERVPGDGDDALSRVLADAGSETDPASRARRVRDELVTLLLAGHETTASTLSWALYLVDRNPGTAERLAEEAVRVLGDREPTHEDLHELTFTTSVVQEAMRLYPPVWILPRKALADDEIGGYHVPAGADVLICPYTLHRRPDSWDRPEAFDPDRFGPGRREDRHRYAYIPFGAGPRVCVGSNLGMMEAVFVLASISRELRLTLPPGHLAVPEPMLSLRVRDGLPMTVRPL
ncbi:cytochrome P450 [Nocardiopsis sp. NRRL B-16309]|uniref:cytochrome P450 n=1 Tax=Nocardiopsis sp. NRRL B-16309 TaxID=1519494 RepID=UPI0006AF3155|nr:cytochrome P450 [Nocardiopsis sp. NRRL B-16309]KOX24119.1 cytochrome P450 [Nocardiopsis sp. NRRL B-16309]